MTTSLTVMIERWLGAESGPPELQETAAYLRIAVGSRVVTRAESEWSKTVDDSVPLAAYPLATWLASSFWRLRWESAPAISVARDISFRMAHELPAAGGGFLWPRLSFESDGETIEAVWRQTSDLSEPLRYVASGRDTVGAADFERAIDDYLALTLARLDDRGVGGTELHNLCAELQEERATPATALWRRLEAQLGFEPDDAPAELIQRLQALSTRIGTAAVSELATGARGQQPIHNLQTIEEIAKRRDGTPARVAMQKSVVHTLLERGPDHEPWARGRLAARAARQAWSLGTDPLSDISLATLLEIPQEVLTEQSKAAARPPIGLAIRSDSGGQDLQLFFRRRNRPGRRFEAARFIAEQLQAPTTDRWLAATDARTARQKTQRAFAAELLCPIDVLKSELAGDYGDEALEEAAERFGISVRAVQSQLANHDLIPFEAVDTAQSAA